MGSYIIYNAPVGGPAPACSFPGGNFADGNAICDWGYRKKVTIDNTKVAADLTDYLLMVDLSDMGSNFHSNVKSDGADIRVTKSDGSTEMAYYVSQIDTTGETGILWVRYNGTLSSTTDTDIYIYFGNATASAYAVSDTYGRNNTFQDYEAFWDFEQDPSGSAPQLTDLTGNGNDGTSQGAMTSGDEVTGKVGNAWDFDGADDGADIPNNSFTSAFGSVGVWFNADTLVANSQLLGSKDTDDGFLQLTVYQSTFYRLSILVRPQAGISANIINAGSTINTGTNYHAIFQSDGTEYFIYLGGIAESLSVTSGANDGDWFDTLSTIQHSIAKYPTNVAYLDGKISSLWVTNNVLSSNYIATEYANQNSPSTFYTVGTIETP